jgi:hypothetical protein
MKKTTSDGYRSYNELNDMCRENLRMKYCIDRQNEGADINVWEEIPENILKDYWGGTSFIPEDFGVEIWEELDDE